MSGEVPKSSSTPNEKNDLQALWESYAQEETAKRETPNSAEPGSGDDLEALFNAPAFDGQRPDKAEDLTQGKMSGDLLSSPESFNFDPTATLGDMAVDAAKRFREALTDRGENETGKERVKRVGKGALRAAGDLGVVGLGITYLAVEAGKQGVKAVVNKLVVLGVRARNHFVTRRNQRIIRQQRAAQHEEAIALNKRHDTETEAAAMNKRYDEETEAHAMNKRYDEEAEAEKMNKMYDMQTEAEQMNADFDRAREEEEAYAMNELFDRRQAALERKAARKARRRERLGKGKELLGKGIKAVGRAALKALKFTVKGGKMALAGAGGAVLGAAVGAVKYGAKGAVAGARSVK